MAEITDPRAIAFTDRLREAATQLEAAYWYAQRLQREWFAQDMSALITNTADPIVDGNTDKPLTGAQATNVVVRAIELAADYDADGYAKLNTVLLASKLGQGIG